MEAITATTPKSRLLSVLFGDIWLGIRIPRIQIFIIAFALAIIWTYNTEQVVKLNLEGNADVWGYGQISAMILSVAAVAGVSQLFVQAMSAKRYVLCFIYCMG